MDYNRIEYSIVFFFLLFSYPCRTCKCLRKETLKIMRNMQKNKVLFLNQIKCHLLLKPIRNLYQGRPILGQVVLLQKFKKIIYL